MIEPVRNHVFEELLGSTTEFMKDIINLPALEKTLSDPRKRKTAGHTIFGLYMFNRWLRTHSTSF